MSELFYDVLVVGAGNAGLCAAMAARELGCSVGVLEKAPREQRGGNSALTAHMRFSYNSVEDLVPLIKDVSERDIKGIAERLPRRTEADLWDEIMRATEGQSDQDLVHVHVSESYKTVRWLESKGHEWIPTHADPTAGNVILMNGGGYALQERNFTFLERDGVPIHYDTAATELIQDDQGRVVGVRALTSDDWVTIRAKSVVLTCGGFEGNPEMMARYLGPRWDTARLRGVPFNTGDGLQMAMEIGAMPYGSWSSCHASPQDLNLPPYSLPSSQAMGGIEWNRYAYPFGILVNVDGERFADEGEDIRALTYAKMGRAILGQPEGAAFQIFDAKARRQGLLSAYDRATGAKASSLEKLGDELGVDPRSLAETASNFNAAIQPGEANLNPFVKDGISTSGITPAKSNYSISIDEPPFEGYAIRCGITFTFGGLKVDPKTTQVQHVRGRPVPGLYTAGEMLGGLWHWNYPSGSGMMAGSTFGRISGASAGEAALKQ